MKEEWQGWREYQKRNKFFKVSPKKTTFILLLASFIIFVAAGSPFLDTSNLTQKLSYTIEENNIRLIFDEGNIKIEGEALPPLKDKEGDKFVSHLGKDIQVIYTIDPLLQDKITELFAKYKVPYGVFVAISPKTGKVLAMVEHSEGGLSSKHLALRSTYPAASIFKLITAAAALEKGKVDTDTVINYSGGLYTLTPRNWVDNPKRDKKKITLADAMGKSCNVAFAKVALKWLNANDLLGYAEQFGFNKPLDFEFPVDISHANVDKTQASIARTAAGFGDVTLSPLHGVMLASAIANNGKMIAPRIIEKVIYNGNDIYSFTAKELDECISPDTAYKLKYMMMQTVENGTSRNAFYTRRGDAYLKDIVVGGKTGSLDGDDPPGDYSWFVGMAPLYDPEIAVAALVINKPKWQIKAPFVAREGFLTYFNGDRLKTASIN